MSLSYLIDTDWVIDHFHSVEKVVDKLEELASDGLAVSIISLAELYEGIYYSIDPIGNEGALKEFLGGISVIGIDEGICKVFGKERGELRLKGRTISVSISLLLAPASTTTSPFSRIIEGIMKQLRD
jgi:tRNA(fMet)-specific endonuclease VapC